MKEGSLIVGRIDSDNDGSVTDGDAGDVAAFAISLGQDGNAAIAQYVSLKHPNAANPDDQVDLTGKVNAVVTVTDGDGDTSIDTFGIGDKLNFDDDGPSLADPNNTVVSFVNSTLIDAVDNDVAEPLVETDGDDHVAVNFVPGQDQEGASLAITALLPFGSVVWMKKLSAPIRALTPIRAPFSLRAQSHRWSLRSRTGRVWSPPARAGAG